MAAVLAERSGLGSQETKAIVDAIADAPWLAPDGIEVARIDMADDGVPMRAVEADGRLDAVTVVSPFLDATFLKRAATWGDEATTRKLVSTRQALAGVAQTARSQLSRFDQLLALDAPDPPLDVDPATADVVPPGPPAGDDADPMPPSLHAKLFCLERGDRTTLLMGSANATSRAWDGRNAELVAELRGGSAIIEGLAHLVGSAMPVTIEELGRATPAEATLREELELSRRRLVSAWLPRLARDGLAFVVEVDPPGPTLAAGMALSVGLAATDLTAWPAGAVWVALGDVPLGRQTNLLRCEIRSGDAAVGWMQRATVTPPLDPERDATALAGLMGFGAFQGWMRQLLSGDTVRDDNAPWDGQIEGTAPNPAGRRPRAAHARGHRRLMGRRQEALPSGRCALGALLRCAPAARFRRDPARDARGLPQAQVEATRADVDAPYQQPGRFPNGAISDPPKSGTKR